MANGVGFMLVDGRIQGNNVDVVNFLIATDFMLQLAALVLPPLNASLMSRGFFRFSFSMNGAISGSCFLTRRRQDHISCTVYPRDSKSMRLS